MIIKYNNIFKILFILSLLVYVNCTNITLFSLKFDASLTLLFSIILMYKGRKNIPVFLMAFFITYCNYSIVIGEYLVGGHLGVPMTQVKIVEVYGETIRMLLLFISIVTMLYKSNKVTFSDFKLIPKDNIFLFYSLLAALIVTFLFGLDRSGEMNSYSVRITPLYEYSILLFVFAYYFSGKSKLRRRILIIFSIIFIFSDFYYGGRITSLQIIFFFLVTMFLDKVNTKAIFVYGLMGILINRVIGAYRQSFSMDLKLITNTMSSVFENFFVFDTPVYAYYGSATHTAASNLISNSEQFQSLLSFLSSIFVGSWNEIGNVTKYVGEHYFYNVGGGLIPTHFYFWLGWIGVILISLIIVYLTNKIGKVKSDFKKLCLVTFIITVPRWFLYSPLNLFRPLFFITVLYICLLSANKIFFGSVSKT
jgi:hypothetical protein